MSETENGYHPRKRLLYCVPRNRVVTMNLKTFLRVICCLVLSVLALHSFAAIETHEFSNDLERARYQSLIDEMRCPKCQNQNLAGSDSAISMDLRREIYELIKAGKSDKEITDFMVARYGEFILYKPRVSPLTCVLWGAPVGLFILALVILLVIVRQRRQEKSAELQTALTPQEAALLSDILKNDSTKGIK